MKPEFTCYLRMGYPFRIMYGRGYSRPLPLFLVAVILFSGMTALALIPSRVVTYYTVSSMGISIGKVKTSQHITEEGGVQTVHFETRAAINASFLWSGYHQDTMERGTLRNGTLVHYSRSGLENSTAVDIEGKLDATSFHFYIHEENGTTRLVSIPRSSFVHTTMECPEARLDFSTHSRVTLPILDVEKMMVVKREYHLLENTYYTIGGKKVPCRMVEFSDKNKKSKRWINWDGTTVLMYRQDGNGGSGSYSVKADSVAHE